jgi:hypothetical protein
MVQIFTVNYPAYTSIVRYIVNIPTGRYYDLESIIIGILISDGWLQINKAGNTRLFFKQSVDKIEYVLYVFYKLSHYCSSYPQIIKTKFNGKIFYGIFFTTRSFPCFTKFYEMFYNNKIKIVPLDLYNLLTYKSFCH